MRFNHSECDIFLMMPLSSIRFSSSPIFFSTYGDMLYGFCDTGDASPVSIRCTYFVVQFSLPVVGVHGISAIASSNCFCCYGVSECGSIKHWCFFGSHSPSSPFSKSVSVVSDWQISANITDMFECILLDFMYVCFCVLLPLSPFCGNMLAMMRL